MSFKLFACYIAKIFTFFICVVYASQGVLESVSPRSDIPSKRIPNERHEARMLRAARLKSDLTTRSITETLRHNHELHYLDESLLGKPQQFAARLLVTSKRPTLNLEEIEDQLSEINCDGNKVGLGFITIETLELAYREYSSVNDFLSHLTRVATLTESEMRIFSEILIFEQETLMVLTVSPMPWKSAFHSLTVDFGESDAYFEVRRHEDLRKRQDTPTTATLSPANSAASTDLSASPTISFPVPSSSPTPQQSDGHGTVGFQYLNKTILSSDIPEAEALGLPNGFTVKCKNCTTQGTVHLLQGSFSVNQTDGANNTENSLQFIRDGYVELRVDDFAAHIELESSIQPSPTLVHYTVQLTKIGLPGFQIPGIAVVGPIFNPSITTGVQLSAAFDFIYGFDITVPNNSSLTINIANVTKSNVTGFPKTQISAIPFQAQLASVPLTFSASFTPEILLGISLFHGLGRAGVGVLFDLPNITARVSQVTHVDSNCNPVTNSSTAGDILDDTVGSLTNIVPEVAFDVGLVEVGVGAINTQISDQWTAISTAYTMPTACFSFDAGAKTYGAAAVKKTSSVQTSSVHKNAGARGIVNPFTRVLHLLARLHSVSGMGLALIFGNILTP